MTADPAAWVWLAILVTVAAFEGYAVATGRHTLSQWLRRHRVVKWFGIVALTGFLVHVLTERTGRDPQPLPCDETQGF